MPKFAANLFMMFAENPLPKRFAAARSAGFSRVEVLFPYEMSVPEIKAALEENELELALINTPPGDFDAGERGFAALPGKQAEFQSGVERAVTYAKGLDVPLVHLMAGIVDGAPDNEILLRNISWAVENFPDQNFTLEPINQIDAPGYAMADYEQAIHLINTISAPNLHLQFDAYHAHRITGDVMAAWAKYRESVAHIQVAGFPGRHEPIGGDIPYAQFFETLDNEGYQGVVSGEYFPAGRTEEGLSWAGLS